MANGLIRAIWWLSRRCLPLTHRGGGTSWVARRWAIAFRLCGHPWLWCACGDSLETWQEVRRRKCVVCQAAAHGG